MPENSATISSQPDSLKSMTENKVSLRPRSL